MRAARRAGNQPDSTPTAIDTSSVPMITPIEGTSGKPVAAASATLASVPISSPSSPPARLISVASTRNCARMSR